MNTETDALDQLEKVFNTKTALFEDCFHRKQGFCVGKMYIKGLLSRIDRKNAWQIAEGTGSETPHKFQNLLNRGSFKANEARDINQKMLIEELGKDGILAIDETGFLKKGMESAGVQRQYSGTAGRVENCQVGVFASYKTTKGHALIDRELYIPEEWLKDKERCKKAGIPEKQEFLTKNQIAANIFNKFKEKGHTCSWVTADEAYGRDSGFAKVLDKAKQQYVLAIPKNLKIDSGLLILNADDLVQRQSPESWQRLSCGDGSKGKRVYDWLLIKRRGKAPKGFVRYLLARRNIKDSQDIAYYNVLAKKEETLQGIVEAAGSRWSIEECFEMAKGETGLDQYEVRTWPAWYRYITLSMIALSILCISRARLLLKPETSESMGEFKKKRLQK